MNPASQLDLLIVSDLHLSEGRLPETKDFSAKDDSFFDKGFVLRSEGRSPEPKKFFKNEDFFFDEEFARFLAYYQDQTRWPGKKWHLIINGDFLDFLQVTSQKDAPSSLHRDPDHPEYGLACGEPETVYKLGKIVEGHWQFFEALAGFAGSGNMITITKGNHDVEFHYAAVQEELLKQLRKILEKKLIQAGDPTWAQKVGMINGDSIRFADWFYYEKDLLWIEHGNQYDKENSFKYWLSPLLPKIPKWPRDRQDEIDLPWGSLFVRYLFNKIEKIEPFADNIKPQTEFVRWLLLTHPIMAVRFLFGNGRYMFKKMHRGWQRLPKGAYAQRAEEQNERLGVLARQSGIGKEKLQCLDQKHAAPVLTEPSGLMWKVFRLLVLSWLVLPVVGLLVAVVVAASLLAVSPALRAVVPSTVQNFAWKLLAATPIGPWLTWALPVIRWAIVLIAIAAIIGYLICLFTREKTRELSYLAAHAKKICQCLNVKYVLMGHTHDPDLRAIGKNGQEYFNTGTWTKVFSEEERLIRKEVEFVFVQALRKSDRLQVKLLEWDDAANEPRLLKLFQETNPTAKRNGH